MSIELKDIGEIVQICNDNSSSIGDTQHSNNNVQNMYNRLKNTKSSLGSIKKLSEAIANGSTIGNSEEELEEAISTIVEKLDSKNQVVEPATEYVIAYSSNSTNDKSPAELEIASLETFDVSGYDWGNVGNGIELIGKYSKMSKKGNSVLEMKNVIRESFEYMHQNNLNFDSFKIKMDEVYQAEIKKVRDKYHLKTEEIKTNHSGLVKAIKLTKEKVMFELYENPPSFSAQELCNRITGDKNFKYN